MQRFGFCEQIKQPLAAVGEINYPIVDPFTLVHAAVGVLFSALGLGLLPTVFIAALWEIAEHLLKNCIPDAFVFPSQDTLRNALGDIAATAAGWFLIRRARDRVPPESTSDATDADLTPA